MWWSTDPLSWPEVATGTFRGAENLRVAGSAAGYVAVSCCTRRAVWSSGDAVTWTLADPGPFEGASISDVTATDDAFLIAGHVDDGRTYDAAIWRSENGIDWQRRAAADPALAGPDDATIGGVVAFGRGLFAHGRRGPHEERVQCEQLLQGGSITAAVAARDVALSCRWGQDAWWVSRDGTAWQQVRIPPRPMYGFTAGGPGLIALSEDEHGNKTVWTSPDGREWSMTRPAPQFDSGATVATLIPLERTLAGFGEVWDGASEIDGAIWIGTVR